MTERQPGYGGRVIGVAYEEEVPRRFRQAHTTGGSTASQAPADGRTVIPRFGERDH